jgi:PEP-CTERM motif
MMTFPRPTALAVCLLGLSFSSDSAHAAIIGGVNLGNLPSYVFVFTDGSTDANWQGASKGFVGDVAVNGISASERTSGTVPYAGTIYTNDTTLGAWQNIVDDNAGQAFGSTGQVSRLSGLQTDLAGAFTQINGLAASAGYASVSATSLNGLNTQNGISETFVINVTSGFSVSSQINITGDAGDTFILRWDTNANSADGYQGQVKFQSGGAIVPLGGLTPANFVHVAGDLASSGGGSNPAPPYPQGPRLNNGTGALITGGSNFNGGGFFTGYWLTTGDPSNGQTSSLSNAIFVGGWYSSTNKFSMTSGTSGVYVSPPVPEPASACLALLALGAIGVVSQRSRMR